MNMLQNNGNKYYNLNSVLFNNINNGEVKKVAVHNGPDHSDDILSIATINIVAEMMDVEKPEIFRTRNPKVLEEMDLLIDVGGKYDGEKNFDHHQREGAPIRENGVKYCSFGQLWKELGIQVILHFTGTSYNGENIEVVNNTFDKIDKNLVMQIDRIDNGDRTFKSGDLMDLADLLTSFGNSFEDVMDDKIQMEHFKAAVSFAEVFLKMYVIKTYKEVNGYETIKKALLEAGKAGESVVFIPKGCGPWKSVLPEVWEETKSLKAAIMERIPGKEYGITMWPDVATETFGLRCKLKPEMRETHGMLFVHANGFFGTFPAASLEEAMEKGKKIAEDVEMME